MLSFSDQLWGKLVCTCKSWMKMKSWHKNWLKDSDVPLSEEIKSLFKWRTEMKINKMWCEHIWMMAVLPTLIIASQTSLKSGMCYIEINSQSEMKMEFLWMEGLVISPKPNYFIKPPRNIEKISSPFTFTYVELYDRFFTIYYWNGFPILVWILEKSVSFSAQTYSFLSQAV